MYMGLSNEDGNPHRGQMNFATTRSIRKPHHRGRAVFDNSDGTYTPGLYARLKLVGSGTYDAMLINDEGRRYRSGKKFVLVMDCGQQNRLPRR